MNSFDESLLRKFGGEYLRKVRSVKVGIAGAGGLGSNCAFNLARAGFDNFRIIDFDKVEYSNLDRQFYFMDQVGMRKVEALEVNLRRINPDIRVDAVALRIERDNVAEILGDCDMAVEAFDRAEYKSLLVEAMGMAAKFTVSASGLAGIGGSDDIKVNHINDHLIVIGDMESDAADTPPISPRVNIAAAKQADVILEHVLGLD